MADESVDYAAVLAAMEASRAKLDSAIVALREWLSMGGGREAGTVTSPSTSNHNLPPSGQKPELPTDVDYDTFFSLSIPEAIKKYLAMKKRPQSVSAITEALRHGGLSTTAADLLNTVTATLTRMRKSAAQEVVIVRRGEWGLKEWYPGRRFDQPEAKKPKKRGRPSKPSKNKDATSQQRPSALTDEQIELVKSLDAAGKSLNEIAKELGVHHLRVMNSKAWQMLHPPKQTDTPAAA